MPQTRHAKEADSRRSWYFYSAAAPTRGLPCVISMVRKLYTRGDSAVVGREHSPHTGANAADTAAALAARAEQVCRSCLPNGRKQGRYWCAGDAHGAAGRSLFVRLAPPGAISRFTDSATGQHGELRDLIRLAIGARSLREALAEAHRFLGQTPSPAAERPETYDRTAAARNLWNRCRPIDGSHGEASPTPPPQNDTPTSPTSMSGRRPDESPASSTTP